MCSHTRATNKVKIEMEKTKMNIKKRGAQNSQDKTNMNKSIKMQISFKAHVKDCSTLNMAHTQTHMHRCTRISRIFSTTSRSNSNMLRVRAKPFWNLMCNMTTRLTADSYNFSIFKLDWFWTWNGSKELEMSSNRDSSCYINTFRSFDAK